MNSGNVSEIHEGVELQESCLVCGHPFDADHEPVLECRGVRACSICRSRSSLRGPFVIESYTQLKKGVPQYARLFGYWGEVPKLEWTEDSRTALQFAREDDAAYFAGLYPKEFCLAKVKEIR